MKPTREDCRQEIRGAGEENMGNVGPSLREKQSLEKTEKEKTEAGTLLT